MDELVSYTQNFEDGMLWRALTHVEHGFYIDVAAQDPAVDSMSFAFEECDWRGVYADRSPKWRKAAGGSR